MKTAPGLPTLPESLDIVRRKVDGLRFVVFQTVIHERYKTEIERRNETRIDSKAGESKRRRESV